MQLIIRYKKFSEKTEIPNQKTRYDVGLKEGQVPYITTRYSEVGIYLQEQQNGFFDSTRNLIHDNRYPCREETKGHRSKYENRRENKERMFISTVDWNLRGNKELNTLKFDDVERVIIPERTNSTFLTMTNEYNRLI